MLRLSQKMLVIVAIPVIFEISILSILFAMVLRLDEARQAESHARKVATHLNHLSALHLQRMYCLILQHVRSTDHDFLDTHAAKIVDQEMKEVDAIDVLTRDYPDERPRWEEVRDLMIKNGDSFNSYKKELVNEEGLSKAFLLSGMQRDLARITSIISELSDEQAEKLNDKQDLFVRYDRELKVAIAWAALASVLIASALITYFTRSTTRRFDQLMGNTERLTANLAPIAAISGNDEIATIDSLYHRLHQSITQLRIRERAVLDNANDVIGAIDSGLRFIEINEAAQRLWGYEKNDLLGLRVAEIVREDQRRLISSTFAGGGATPIGKFVAVSVLKKDGGLADTEWALTRSEGDENGYLVIHDVTEKKQVERLKQEFVAMVSHDLRTPLSSIQLTLGLLEAEASSLLSEESRQDLVSAASNANRLMLFINQLLDLERLDNGHLSISPDSVNVLEMTKEATGYVKALADKKSMQIVSEVDAHLEAFCDRERIIQVTVNLLGNAIKFSPPESHLRVEAKLTESSCRISVVDSGRGVPKALQMTIFDRFQQVEENDQNEMHGAGLGLAICKMIVGLHFGRIGVDSTQGHGSVFWFTIPRSELVYERLKAASQ